MGIPSFAAAPSDPETRLLFRQRRLNNLRSLRDTIPLSEIAEAVT